MPKQPTKSRGRGTSELKALRHDLEAYSRQDQADHARLYKAIGEVKAEVSGTKGQLTVISDILEEQREERKIERQEAADLKKLAAENKLSSARFRRNLILKVAAVVGPLAAGLTHLLHHC